MTRDLSQAWWPAQPAALDPLQALREVADALEQGRVVPPAVAQHHARALRTYLAGECDDITRNLGLRPRRGGRHEGPLARERLAQRNELLCVLVDAQPGQYALERAAAAASLLATPDPAAAISDEHMRQVVQQLQREFAGELPRSREQLHRLTKSRR